jgi:hypothetical protein
MSSRDLATSPVGLKLPAVARAERSGAEAYLNLDIRQKFEKKGDWVNGT